MSIYWSENLNQIPLDPPLAKGGKDLIPQYPRIVGKDKFSKGGNKTPLMRINLRNI